MADNPLGKVVEYPQHYLPQVLVAIPRKESRVLLGLTEALPFFGADIWNAYEVSWLDKKGKPQAAILRLFVPCDSTNLVESKSLKLYLNSFNQEKLDSIEELAAKIQNDIEAIVKGEIGLSFNQLHGFDDYPQQVEGRCLDDMDIEISTYQPDASFLMVDDTALDVSDVVYTHLFRSNCPITQQPDWATVSVSYQGKPIDHEGLLRYLVSYRQHDDYHENCVERIFCDIRQQCSPECLTVEANFLRRGGIDINPVRTTERSMQYNEYPRYLRQ